MRSENFIESGNSLDEKAKSLIDAFKSGGRLSPEIREALLKSLALPQQESATPSLLPQKEHGERDEDFVNYLTENWFDESKVALSGISKEYFNSTMRAVFHRPTQTWFIGPYMKGIRSSSLRSRIKAQNEPLPDIDGRGGCKWKLVKLAQMRYKKGDGDLPMEQLLVSEVRTEIYNGDLEFEFGELEHTN